MKIVLLHGWGDLAAQRIMTLTEALRARGHEVFAPSLPGFGESDPPPEPWDVDAYVQWTFEQVAKKGWDQFTLCGYSFGGRIAIKLAATNPDNINNMVLIAASGLKHQLSMRAQLLRAVGWLGKRIFSLPFLSLFKTRIHGVWRTILKRKDYYRASGVMQKTFLKIIAEDLHDTVKMITVPTLILWGKKDQMVPVTDAHFMHEHIPSSQLKIFAQGDHFFVYEYPEELAEEIDEFVKQR